MNIAYYLDTTSKIKILGLKYKQAYTTYYKHPLSFTEYRIKKIPILRKSYKKLEREVLLMFCIQLSKK